MKNAVVKLSKGQKKKLKLRSKREAEAASTSTPGRNGSKPSSGGPPQQQGSSKASRKRPAPGSATNESSRDEPHNGAAGVNDAGIVASKKKKRSDANESLAMRRRSKSYASQSQPASTQKFKAAQAHAPSSKKPQPPGEGNAGANGGSKNKGGGGVLSGGSKGLTSLQERMRAKLEGAKFRMINEELYTSTGSAAFQRYQDDPSLFEIYHRGYREQVAKWPENPLSAILDWLKTLKDHLVVADFGCGDAVLARDAPPNVEKCHSFDLVSVNSRVVACDMANVPLADASTDVCVFCLSLMGTNLADYLREAKRVLKQPNGLLKIAEVRSRVDGMEGGLRSFIGQVCQLGFRCLHNDQRNPLFVLLEFRVVAPAQPGDAESMKGRQNHLTEAEQNALVIAPKPCIYKRR